MADDKQALPMTPKWDPEKLQQEVTELQELERKPFLAKSVGYLKRTGPGLMQSAMTLGAGSAAASVVAGASFGYKMLWVQPVAMFLGVMMLAALANVVLTTGERPFRGFGRQLGLVGWILVALWAIGTVMASVIWHFPQYGLAAGAVRDLANLAGVNSAPAEGEAAAAWGYTSAGLIISFATGFAILAINIIATWSYGAGSLGMKIYEWFLRGVIGLIIVAFGIVVIANFGNIEWGQLGRGFIGADGIPQADEQAVDAAIAAGQLDAGDKAKAMDTMTLVLGMLGAAVGINMTFLYPYSILAKGWGKHHKNLARWDLGMSMFVPFVLVTSLVILAMSVSGVFNQGAEYVRFTMKPLDAAQSLTGSIGEQAGRIVFDLGLIGMACGAISAHMVVCGFTVCEVLSTVFDFEYTKWWYRVFTLTPAIGVLGVVTQTPIWFPIAASAVCFTMLPIAYVVFLVMNNRRSYIGDAVGSGWKRVVFNLLLVIALAVATVGACIKIKSNVIDKVGAYLFPPSAAAPAEQAPKE